MTTDYQHKMALAEPFFEHRGEKIELLAPDGVTLVVHYFTPEAEPPRGTVLLVPGRAEAQIKYAEVVYDFIQRGFAVTLFDHRGQGLSGRLLADPHPGHVKRFSDYIRDMEAIWYHVVVPRNEGVPKFILSHSLGGLITAHFLSRHPDGVSAAVLLAPLFNPHTAPVPQSVAELIAQVACDAGFGEEYAPGRGPFLPNISFDRNDWCGSPERFAHYMRLRREHPEYNLGGPTLRWLHEIYGATRSIGRRASRITAPLLVCTTGLDTLVESQTTRQIVKSIDGARLKHFPTARHELLFEDDPLRDQCFQLIEEFLTPFALQRVLRDTVQGAA
jgi:lysophospholipase